MVRPGSSGQSYDNALAESINSLYKAELIYGPDQGPWKTIEDVELVTTSWVHWFNTQRLSEGISSGRYSVDRATTVAEGFGAIVIDEYDVCIADRHVGVRTGFDLLSRITAEGLTQQSTNHTIPPGTTSPVVAARSQEVTAVRHPKRIYSSLLRVSSPLMPAQSDLHGRVA